VGGEVRFGVTNLLRELLTLLFDLALDAHDFFFPMRSCVLCKLTSRGRRLRGAAGARRRLIREYAVLGTSNGWHRSLPATSTTAFVLVFERLRDFNFALDATLARLLGDLRLELARTPQHLMQIL